MWSMMAWKSGKTFSPSTPFFVETHPAQRVGIEDREVDLVFIGVEVQEELFDLVDDFVDPGVGPVDLVDDQDNRQSCLERLAQHETGLGQRALRGVHQQEDTIDHVEPPLDLTTEVSVTGGVDDVHLHPTPAHRGVLGQDGDALLAFEVARVHDPVGHLLVGAEGAGLAQHGVDQGRLAVVDVGHDGYVANVISCLHGGDNDRPGRRVLMPQPLMHRLDWPVSPSNRPMWRPPSRPLGPA